MSKARDILISSALGIGLTSATLMGTNEFLLDAGYGDKARACADTIEDNEVGAVVPEGQLSPQCKAVSQLMTSETVTVRTLMPDGDVDMATNTEYTLPDPDIFIASVAEYDQDFEAKKLKVGLGLGAIFSPVNTHLFYSNRRRRSLTKAKAVSLTELHSRLLQ